MRFLVSVCRSDTCTPRGSDELYAELIKQVKAAGLEDEIKLQRGGCYGLCKQGPNCIVREGAAAQRILDDVFGSDFEYRGTAGEFHYARLTHDEVSRVVQEHFIDGSPVTEFLDRTPQSDDESSAG